MNHQVICGREISIVFADENRKTPQEMRSTGRTRYYLVLFNPQSIVVLFDNPTLESRNYFFPVYTCFSFLILADAVEDMAEAEGDHQDLLDVNINVSFQNQSALVWIICYILSSFVLEPMVMSSFLYGSIFTFSFSKAQLKVWSCFLFCFSTFNTDLCW